MKKSYILTLMVMIIIILLGVVVWQNWLPLTFRLFFWKVEIAKSLAFLIIYALGIVSGLYFSHLFRRR